MQIDGLRAKPKRSLNWKLFAVTGAIIILLISLGWWMYGKRDISDVKQVISLASKHVILPTDEEPALATVTDPSKLGHQKFFKDSQSGDKLLIYAQKNTVILYRPSVDRVVNMGPVDIQPINEDGTTK